MKLAPWTAIAAALFSSGAVGQDLSGKWYGKITQGPGGYAAEYSFELELEQRNEQISGVSFAYYKEDVVARFNYYGFFEGPDRIILQEDLVMEQKTPPQWEVCVKRMVLEYVQEDSLELLRGEWAGIGITDGEVCIPGEVYLSRNPAEPQTLPQQVLPPDTAAVALSPDTAEATLTSGSASPPGGRILTSGKEITVRSPEIIVKIVDYQIIDGDIVTVYFNEEKVVDKQQISKEPIVLNLSVAGIAGPAKLLLYAENLGRIPPNTALMVVEDRRGRQQIKLESDYERSDVLYIRYKP